MIPLRAVVVTAVERLLAYGGPAHLLRRRFRQTTLVLAYHNVVPTGDRRVGVASLHLSQRDFADQLDRVLETHDVVPLTELHAATSRPERPRVVITFDDAYAGAMSAGVEELARRGLPATFFVTPGFLDGRSFWWDALDMDEDASEAVREHLLGAGLQGRDDRVRAWARREGIALRELPGHATGASVATLRAALARPGITIGTHSWSHPNLATLAPAEIHDELARSRTWLEREIGPTVPWVAYPYGRSSRTVEQVGDALGLAGGLLIEGGFVAGGDAPTMATPRLNVPSGVSREGFTLRMSGLIR